MKWMHHSNDDPQQVGVVHKKIAGIYSVAQDGRTISCTLSAELRQPGSRAVQRRGKPSGKGHNRQSVEQADIDTVVVGDRVLFVDFRNGSGSIQEVLPRRNWVSRRSAVPMPSARPYEQVIVANVDQVVPVFAAANPAPKWNLLDRYLVSAESAGISSLICITKVDLVQNEGGQLEEVYEAVEEYRRIGYPVLLVSALTGEGLEGLKQSLQGRLSVFLGKSGVGKTSLLNALEPGLGLRVNQVSRVTGKGKHTTTHLEMFSLAHGEAIIDTPGVREFGLWEVEQQDLALFFPEMQPYVGKCRFGLGCRHDEEPGCAIRKAVTAGQVSPRRYQSYLRLLVNA